MALLPSYITEHSATPTLLIILYVIATGFTIGLYVGYFKDEKGRYGDKLVNAHLAFTIVGTITFAAFSAVMWLWAAKYSETVNQRSNKLTIGLCAIFLLRDLPLFCIEYHAILEEGWRQPYQGFCFIVSLLYFLMSGIFSWLNYAWIGARYMNTTFGDGDHGAGLKTGAEQLYVLRPASPTEGQGWDRQMLPPPMREGSNNGGGSYSPANNGGSRYNGGGSGLNRSRSQFDDDTVDGGISSGADQASPYGRRPTDMFGSSASPVAQYPSGGSGGNYQQQQQHNGPSMFGQSSSPPPLMQQSGSPNRNDQLNATNMSMGANNTNGGGYQAPYAQQNELQQQLAQLKQQQQQRRGGGGGMRRNSSLGQINFANNNASNYSASGNNGAPQQQQFYANPQANPNPNFDNSYTQYVPPQNVNDDEGYYGNNNHQYMQHGGRQQQQQQATVRLSAMSSPRTPINFADDSGADMSQGSGYGGRRGPHQQGNYMQGGGGYGYSNGSPASLGSGPAFPSPSSRGTPSSPTGPIRFANNNANAMMMGGGGGGGGNTSPSRYSNVSSPSSFVVEQYRVR